MEEQVRASERSVDKLTELQKERGISIGWVPYLLEAMAMRELFVNSMIAADVSGDVVRATTLAWAMRVVSYGSKLGLHPQQVKDDIAYIKTLAQTDHAMQEKARSDAPMQ